MAIRRSTKLVNELARGFGVRELLRDGRIFVYSGAQPAASDDSPSGTLLLEFTLNGSPYTDSIMAEASIAIGGSAVGALETITVGGMEFNLLSEAVSYETSAEYTVMQIVDNINAKQNPLNISAAANGIYVVLKAPHWVGSGANGLTFNTTVSGNLTATTSGVFASGVRAINGINFSESVTDGTIAKDATTWQASAVATGTAGWFRFVPCGSTVDGTTNNDARFDGSVGTNNAELIISTTAIVKDAVHTISSGTITEVKE